MRLFFGCIGCLLLVLGTQHFFGVGQGVFGNGNTTEHSGYFLDFFITAQVTKLSAQLFAVSHFLYANMVVALTGNLGLVRYA